MTALAVHCFEGITCNCKWWRRRKRDDEPPVVMWAESTTSPQFAIIGENKQKYNFLIQDTHDIDCLVIDIKGSVVMANGPRLGRSNSVGRPFTELYDTNLCHAIQSIVSVIKQQKRNSISLNTLYGSVALTLSAFPVMHDKAILGVCLVYHRVEYSEEDLEFILTT